MKTILLTGANGLIGGNLLPELANNTYEIYALVRGEIPGTANGVHYLQCDLSRDWDVSKFPTKIDCVIHLAQSEFFRDFPENSRNIFNVNVDSTIRLLDYARKAGAKKFIYASSGGIYGNSNEEFNEEFPVTMRNDLGFYLGTKFCSELLAQNYSTFFAVNILRFFFVFGERQKKDMLIPRLLNSIKEGKAIKLDGYDGLKLNPVYVSDAATAVAKCLNLNGNHRINIAGKEVFTLRQLCDSISNIIGRDPVYTIENSEPRNLIADISKMKNLLHTPEISFSDAISRLNYPNGK